MGPKFYKKKTTYSGTTSTNIGNAIYLIIVESPSKCGKIESYLGQRHIVEAIVYDVWHNLFYIDLHTSCKHLIVVLHLPDILNVD